jgi:trans-2,3-dihydro-3-hydroxyanthranilate isomerase
MASSVVLLNSGTGTFAKCWPGPDTSDVEGISDVMEREVKTARLTPKTRMFAPLVGVPEDPATGGANVALIGLLAHHRPEANLTLARTIGQGFDMGRPSVLEASAEKKAGKVTATYIGGRCVPMMKGTIDLD